MATVKHLSSRNADFNAPYEYLIFQHDEKNGKILRNENGSKMLRDSYIIEGINCSPECFGIECEHLSQSTENNTGRNSIKTHHYIISFDPNDTKENGLSIQKSQQIGLEIARRFFEGHLAIVCTHPDGQNRSGNIHVHIVISAIRKFDAEKQPFMERESDRKARYKHHVSKKFMQALDKYVMDVCKREKLNQIDLFRCSNTKTTNKEFKKNQRESFKGNDFQTRLDTIRNAVFRCMNSSESIDEFQKKLLDDYKIELTISRGSWGYRLPECERSIRAKRLGYAYDRDYVTQRINSVKELINIKNNDKASGNTRYEDALIRINIQRKADTINYLKKYGYSSVKELTDAAANAQKSHQDSSDKIKQINNELTVTGKKIHLMKELLSCRKYYDEFIQSGHNKNYYSKHASMINRYRKAQKGLNDLGMNTSLVDSSSINELKKVETALKKAKNAEYKNIQSLRAKRLELETLNKNVEVMLGNETAVVNVNEFKYFVNRE